MSFPKDTLKFGLPAAFPNVPIIGMAKFGDWCFQITIECPCGKTLLWYGRPAPPQNPLDGSKVWCACGIGYTLTDLPTRNPDGNLSVPFAALRGNPAEGK